MSTELRESMRSLLLPVAVGNESAAVEAAQREMTQRGLSERDMPAWLRRMRQSWRDGTELDTDFQNVVRVAVETGATDYGETLADNFFDLHTALRDEFLLSHEEASAFLSHGVLICRLSAEQKMSSAQVSRTLAQRDARVPFSRQSIDKVVSRLRVKPSFERDDVEDVFNADKEAEETLLADADLETACIAVGDIAASLGASADIARHLRTLADTEDIAKYSPYIQMLHYQCTIAEFFDHALTDLYEFKPRGARVEWLTDRYPDALVGAQNPFLNNAKSVESIDSSWARSKMRQQRYAGALALVGILESLEQLGFAARRELAQWVRMWIHRVMRYAEPATIDPPEVLTNENVAALLGSIATEETNTAGIIEQRVVDALTTRTHREQDGWIARGLKDAVNATNVSRRKIGDCDYQKPATLQAVAFEAHGGPLTEVYFRGHVQTLPKALRPRQEEWSRVSKPEDWRVEVHFIAHEIEAADPAAHEIDGTQVTFHLRTFQDLIDECAGQDLTATIMEYVVKPVFSRTTPMRVREKLIELLDLG